MKIAFVTALIAAAISRGEAAAAECHKKLSCAGASGCIAETGCNWCAGKIVKSPPGATAGATVNTSLKLGYCTTATDSCADAASKFGTLKAMYGTDFEVQTITTAATCLEGTVDADNALVKDKKTCDDCKTAADNHWCQIDSTGAQGGVCLSNTRTSATCADLKGLLSTYKTTKITSCPTALDCSKTTNCSACTKNCVWCGLAVEDTKLTSGSKIVERSGTQVGQCVQKATSAKADACAAVKPDAFGTIAKTFEYTKGAHEYKMVAKVLTTTDAVATPNGWASGAECKVTHVDPLAITKKTHKDCTAEKASWCQTKLDGKTAGGICLGTDATKAKALCDTFTKAGSAEFDKVEVETQGPDPVVPVVVPVDCPVKTSCKVCSAATACVWCGIAIQDTKLKAGNKIVPGSGTQLGSCVSKPTSTTASDACAAATKTFGEIAKALEYTKGDHEYKMIAKPFEGTVSELKANGWESAAECKVTHVDPFATTKLTCDACVKAKAQWCLTDLNDKAAGGVCLGVDAKKGEALCDSFAKPAKSDAFYSVATEIKDKCSANPDAAFSVASASSVALLAAVVAAFVSVA